MADLASLRDCEASPASAPGYRIRSHELNRYNCHPFVSHKFHGTRLADTISLNPFEKLLLAVKAYRHQLIIMPPFSSMNSFGSSFGSNGSLYGSAGNSSSSLSLPKFQQTPQTSPAISKPKVDRSFYQCIGGTCTLTPPLSR